MGATDLTALWPCMVPCGAKFVGKSLDQGSSWACTRDRGLHNLRIMGSVPVRPYMLGTCGGPKVHQKYETIIPEALSPHSACSGSGIGMYNGCPCR